MTQVIAKNLPAWLSLSALGAVVTLTRPSQANSVDVDTLNLRNPTVREVRAADRAANGDDEQRELMLFTGRDNYRLCGKALDLPLLDRPELLEQPEYAALSAAWYWWDRGLNDLADAGLFDGISRKINAGDTGQADRRALWAKAKAVLCQSSI
ncbi:phage tail assembly protein [Pseudomonas sp. CCNWLW23]|uniref:phage tail assembly protein n=1 Tax=Pseudomonas sp. CCNWLW23 TaxID=3126385 RepID=UPI003012B52C